MKNRLLIKILAAFGVTGILAFVLISTLGSNLIYRQVLNSTSRRMYAEASHIASTNGGQSITDEDALNRSLYALRSIAVYENAQIWYISEGGEILLNTAETAGTSSRQILAGFNPVALGTSYYTLGHFFNYFDSDMLSVMVPISNGMQMRGYLAIHLPVNELIRQRESIIRTVLLIFVILYAVFLAMIVILIAETYRPLKKIIRGVRECAGGNMDYQIDVDSNDELGELAQSLNFMTRELRESNEWQRTFISNISHDFRSPLTSIKGYVQAMLDGTIPQEMQERYLNIVLNETKRLEKLTSGILMLNNINSKGTQLDLSTFDINRMIKDTSASFEGTCISRQISIELILTGTELSVYADYGKIQQVLYNLLDNAIKFSPNHSVIQIETTIRHEKVYISVKDHGIGIPSSEINKIWDRFYKIDASRGKDTRGTGLGLAIVRDIINTHGQTIDVISTEHAGTEFIFSLKKH